MEEISIKKTNKELKLGVVLSYLLIALNIISGFFLIPFIINNLGKSNYGLYTAASSLITMFIVDLGLGTAITKFISKYRVTSTQEEIDKLVSVIFYCFLVLAFILCIIFVCIFPFLDSIYSSFTYDEISSFRIVYIIVASYSVLTFPFGIVNGMLVAYDRIFLSKLSDIISRLVFIASTIIVLCLNLGLYWLTACYAIHGIVGILLKFIFVKIKTPCKFINKMEMSEFKRIFKEVVFFSFWAAINSFGRVILISFGPTIIGFSSGEAQGAQEIAVFSIALQIESYVSLFATSFGAIFYPTISRVLFRNGEPDKEAFESFKAFHVKIARFQVLILAITIAGLIVCGKEFLFLWVGEGYDKAYYCILALCIPALFFYPLQTAENAIAAIEKIKYCAISTIIATVVGIGAAIGLAFLLGSIGVSIGICIGFITRIVLFNVCFKNMLTINPLSFYLKAYLSFIVAFASSVVVGVCLNYFFPSYSLATFAVKVVTVALTYFAIACIFSFNKEEKNKVDGYFKLIFGKVSNLLRKVER